MIRLETGVRIDTMSSQIVLAMIIADNVLRSFESNDLVITSICEGKHSRGSLHYIGHAFDIRLPSLDTTKNLIIVNKLNDALNAHSTNLKSFDVVLEHNHIHIEYQPKIGLNL